MKKKLTSSQLYVIEVLGKYDCMIMYNNWVTGGHGVRVDGRTLKSLKKMGIIERGILTERGKQIYKTIQSD